MPVPKYKAANDLATVCCAVCGGDRVQYAVWYHPNEDRTEDVFGSWNSGDNTFCADCDANTDLVDKGSDPKLFTKLRRAKHAKTE